MNNPKLWNPGDFVLRVGLVGTSVVLFNAANTWWLPGRAFLFPAHFILSVFTWTIGIGIGGLALVRRLPHRVEWIIPISLIGALLTSAYINQKFSAPLSAFHTDNEMIAQFAVETLKDGQNPYEWNYSDMLRVYRDREHYTAMIDGTYQNRLTYPALPTLLLWGIDVSGFDPFGMGPVRALSLMAHIVMLGLIFVGSPENIRPVALLPLLALKDLESSTLGGVQDVIWSALLIGALYTWHRPRWRAILFGLACSFRQQPWFAMPFLLIYLWHEPVPRFERLRRMGYFVLVSLGVFLIINLPFIIWNPEAWLLGTLEPVYAAFNFMSHGLGILTQYDIVPLPRTFYTGLQFSVLAIMVVVHWFYARPIGQAFWIFPGIMFWVYYRGLANYWIFWVPVILFAILRALEDRRFSPVVPSLTTMPPRRTKHIIPLMVITAVILVNVLRGIYLVQRRPPLVLSYVAPVEVTTDSLVNRLTLVVTNRAEKPFAPRFAVQSDSNAQPMPWYITSGPEILKPGDVGQYVITAQGVSSKVFSAQEEAQVVVTDAGEDYNISGILRIPAGAAYADSDLIANPDFRYWRQDDSIPDGWTLVTEQGVLAKLSLAQVDKRLAITFTTSTNPSVQKLPVARLIQRVTFPDAFTFWVYPTVLSTDPTREIYGIEFEDGIHRLWILFGDSDATGTLLSENHRYVFHRAPLNQWSPQTIDLQVLYERFGWQLPTPTVRAIRGAQHTVPQGMLSLIAASTVQSAAKWQFGPIEQSKPTESLVKKALDHPDTYYVTVGNAYLNQHNYDLARTAFRQALRYNTTNAAGYFGLGESLFGLNDLPGAVEAYKNALNLGYQIQGSAYKGLGWSEYNQGHYTDAADYFKKAIHWFLEYRQITDNFSVADAYAGAGLAWMNMGQCAKAVPYFQQALTIEPSLANVQTGQKQCQ